MMRMILLIVMIMMDIGDEDGGDYIEKHSVFVEEAEEEEAGYDYAQSDFDLDEMEEAGEEDEDGEE